MVRILLEYGADPKEISGPGPMWEQVLKRARVSSRKGASGERWLQIMKLFVQYSVELRGDSDLDDARRHILNVVERFAAEHPGKVMELQAMIEKRLPRSKRKRLRLWANGR